jgi:hypothetical protein
MNLRLTRKSAGGLKVAKFRPIYKKGEVSKSFASEDGRHYRHFRQDIDPIIERVQHNRDIAKNSTKFSNPNGWQHKGTVPMTVLLDWLQKHGYTFDEFARADRNDVYGPKHKFLKYFTSRDFSKLHNEHVTTKRESSQVLT